MSKPVISLIGAGNMGGSLVGGLIATGYDPKCICATDPDEEKLNALHDACGIEVTTDNQHAAASAEVILFAVKPQTLKSAVEQLAPTIRARKPLLISVAAGIRVKDMLRWLEDDLAVVRCMPNTAALIGSGAIGLYANEHTQVNQKDLAESIMRSVGVTLWVDHEAQMDIVTALSGSGPAYFFLVMEALQNAAIDLGLPPETARLLTLQTGLGASRMALESDKNLTQLREYVTSPGGTTERAVKVLEDGQVRETFAAAVTGACKRAQELADLFSDD